MSCVWSCVMRWSASKVVFALFVPDCFFDVDNYLLPTTFDLFLLFLLLFRLLLIFVFVFCFFLLFIFVRVFCFCFDFCSWLFCFSDRFLMFLTTCCPLHLICCCVFLLLLLLWCSVCHLFLLLCFGVLPFIFLRVFCFCFSFLFLDYFVFLTAFWCC